MTTYMATLVLSVVMMMCGRFQAAPLQGNPMAAEEMQLANLMKQGANSQETDSPSSHMPQTKVLLQKTRIVIPVEDEKPAAAPQQIPVAPQAAPMAPAAPMQQEEEEPMRFVDPPQVPVNQVLSEEENQFLFPADYELHSQEPQFQSYEEAAEPELISPDLDLTPQAVGEYLVLTGDFKGFDEALSDLMQAGLLSLRQVEQYRVVVGQEYERLMEEMAAAEEDYEREQQVQSVPQFYGQQQQEEEQEEQAAEMELQEALRRDAEAGELLQALLQDYMMTENMDANSQEYEDFVDWMESLNDKSDEPMLEDVESEVHEQEQNLPEEVDVEQELEELPMEQEDVEESSGDVEDKTIELNGEEVLEAAH